MTNVFLETKRRKEHSNWPPAWLFKLVRRKQKKKNKTRSRMFDQPFNHTNMCSMSLTCFPNSEEKGSESCGLCVTFHCDFYLRPNAHSSRSRPNLECTSIQLMYERTPWCVLVDFNGRSRFEVWTTTSKLFLRAGLSTSTSSFMSSGFVCISMICCLITPVWKPHSQPIYVLFQRFTNCTDLSCLYPEPLTNSTSLQDLVKSFQKEVSVRSWKR